MKNNIKYILIIINLLLLLGYFNWSVMAKEQVLKEGKFVLLELAPVDPRSLMQGDYMRLNYVVNDVPYDHKIEKRGFIILKLDKKNVARKVRLSSSAEHLKSGEFAIKYFSTGYNNIHVGAESYFFEEGQAKRFEKAKYGALKIDDDGNSVLIGMYDVHQKPISY